MNFHFTRPNTKTNKTSFKSLIKGKQQFFKRLQRRYNASKNPAERTFLKAEAGRVVSELKNFASQWKKNDFGSNGWICRGYNVSCFSTGSNGYSRRTTKSRRSSARRSTSRSSYRAYVAW